jgi:CSLREA domain-containing protein
MKRRRSFRYHLTKQLNSSLNQGRGTGSLDLANFVTLPKEVGYRMLQVKGKTRNLALLGLVTVAGAGLLVIGPGSPAFLAFGMLLAGLGLSGLARRLSARPRAWSRFIAAAASLAMLLQMLLPFTQLVPPARAANFVVNSFADTVDAAPGNGVCADAGGNCTLRAAVMEANALAGNDTISLPQGTYNLTLSDSGGEDLAVDGDLDITAVDTLDIIGQGTGAIINGNFGTSIGSNVENRIFHIIGSGAVLLNNVTIQGGNTDRATGAKSQGGGIYTENNTVLTLRDVTVRNNIAENFGGGILNRATLTLDRVTISGNTSGSTGTGSGGGIRNDNNGQILGQNVTISGNTALNNGAGGGIRNAANSTINLAHATVTSNSVAGAGSGSGITDDSGAGTPVVLANSIIGNNTGAATQCVGTIAQTGGTSLSSDASCGFSIQNVNPNLAALANNGGRTQTHALNPGSPAVDAVVGNSPINEDQRQITRPVNIPGVNDAQPGDDIGAFEFNATLPSLSISNGSVVEGNAPATPTMVFTATLSAAIATTVTVNYTLGGGTASGGGVDYVSTGGAITFPPNTTSRNVNVTVIGDSLNESPDETFNITLTPNTNVWATIGSGSGTGTIIDDDGAPLVAIDDPSVNEGNSGQVDLVFTVQLSFAPGPGGATINYNSVNGTAIAGPDYVSTSGTLIFGPTDTSKTIIVKVNGDTANEGNETVLMRLSGITGNAQFGDNEGVGAIIDDDAGTLPGMSIDDASLTEGNSGTTNLRFTVRLSNSSSTIVTVPFSVLNGSAKLNEDYNPSTTPSPLVFQVGTTVQTITVPIAGETVAEPDETFQVNLGIPLGATISDGQATGTIINDDGPPPTISIADASVAEGNSGPANLEFVVSLNKASTGQITVDYATSNGTATATAAGDFDPATGTLIFAAGQTQQKIMVVINGDTINEPNETFFANLTNPRNAVLADGQAIGTITNDDSGSPSSKGSSGGDNDDDDEEAAAPPPPAAPPAAAAPAPAAGQAAAPPAETAPLPVTTLPDTGVDGSASPFSWLTLVGLAVGVALLGWGMQRRRRRQVAAVTEPQKQLPLTDGTESDAEQKQP